MLLVFVGKDLEILALRNSGLSIGKEVLRLVMARIALSKSNSFKHVYGEHGRNPH
jgi:hypothetical protein